MKIFKELLPYAWWPSCQDDHDNQSSIKLLFLPSLYKKCELNWPSGFRKMMLENVDKWTDNAQELSVILAKLNLQGKPFR